MKKFQVCLTQNVSRSHVVTLEAANENEAQIAALRSHPSLDQFTIDENDDSILISWAKETPPPISEPYYITMTWDDWPEGGCFGTIIKSAIDQVDAETQCKYEMAASRTDGWDDEGEYESEEKAIESFIESTGQDWQVIDCFPLIDFLQHHRHYLPDDNPIVVETTDYRLTENKCPSCGAIGEISLATPMTQYKRLRNVSVDGHQVTVDESGPLEEDGEAPARLFCGCGTYFNIDGVEIR